jgi:pyruvate formate lyase activating enzyme
MSNLITAPINKIINLSVVDGPGARSAIFVQGCNISCVYCHNPETQKLCINCGKCVLTCPTKALTLVDKKVIWDESKCVSCDTCLKQCPHYSSPKIRYLTASESIEILKPNFDFIRGISVSGGECSLYIDYLTELFSLAKQYNLTCLMDSNGTTDLQKETKLMSVCDGVMLDIKSWTLSNYQKITNSNSNSNVIANLKYLALANKLEEVRIVCLDGVDVYAIIDNIVKSVPNNYEDIKLKLITFRNNGVKGALEKAKSPSFELMSEYKDYASKYFKTVLIL